jgi:HAE1 family hydrophobic/amphiphilic exporter-1
LHVEKKPRAANDLGINAVELGYAVNALIDGAYVTDYFVGGDKIDMVLLADQKADLNSQDLQSQYLATRNMAEPVRLDSIADVTMGSGPESIQRRERQRAITIEITPPPTMPLEEAITTIRSKIIRPLEQNGSLGSEYHLHLSGTADKLRETWLALRGNVLLAIVITYLLLAALFESWVYPFVIILSVPLGAVGGILGLKALNQYVWIAGGPPQTLDVVTMLGFVILVGTVVNNPILIVHHSLQLLRNEGYRLAEAIAESVRTRIRPIFMTTLTTIFGLLPLVLFPGAGSELYRGLGAVVLGGLLISTIFTLVLVPTVFSLTYVLMEKLQRSFQTFQGSNTEPPPEPSDRRDGGLEIEPISTIAGAAN